MSTIHILRIVNHTAHRSRVSMPIGYAVAFLKFIRDKGKAPIADEGIRWAGDDFRRAFTLPVGPGELYDFAGEWVSLLLGLPYRT